MVFGRVFGCYYYTYILPVLSIATNFEEDKRSEMADLNADNALMRAEFLEVRSYPTY